MTQLFVPKSLSMFEKGWGRGCGSEQSPLKATIEVIRFAQKYKVSPLFYLHEILNQFSNV